MNQNLPHTSTTSFLPIIAGNRTYVLLLLFQQQAQLSAVITLSLHSQTRDNPRLNSCFTSLIDTCEPGSSITAGTVCPKCRTALPHPRHIPGKAAATRFLNKSPLHPKSERTDSNFPKKITVRMHLFSRCWHKTLFYKGLVSLSTSCRSNLHQALQALEWASFTADRDQLHGNHHKASLAYSGSGSLWLWILPAHLWALTEVSYTW